MLNELKKIEDKPKPINQTSDYNSLELITLGQHLAYCNEAKFEYRGKIVKIKGIPEDFRIYLDGSMVAECVYDNVVSENHALVKELLS